MAQGSELRAQRPPLRWRADPRDRSELRLRLIPRARAEDAPGWLTSGCSCLSRIANDRPAGPAPTTTTSYSMVSRSLMADSCGCTDKVRVAVSWTRDTLPHCAGSGRVGQRVLRHDLHSLQATRR